MSRAPAPRPPLHSQTPPADSTCAVAATAVQLVAPLTDAAEHSRQVLTAPEHTEAPQNALIHICGDPKSGHAAYGDPPALSLTPAAPGLTLAGTVVLRGVEAHLALTAVPAGGIKALPVLTEVHVLRTLIPI